MHTSAKFEGRAKIVETSKLQLDVPLPRSPLLTRPLIFENSSFNSVLGLVADAYFEVFYVRCAMWTNFLRDEFS